MNARRNRAALLSVLSFVISVSLNIFSLAAVPPRQGPATDPKTIPVIDGGIGPCSADFLVTDAAGAPVYNAKIKVHIAYGFMYARKLDLELGTNADGKGRFEGLPTRTKRGLSFQASHEDQDGVAFSDPASTCHANLTIKLQKSTTDAIKKSE